MDLLRRLDRFLSDHLTPAVKLIFTINVSVFLLLLVLRLFSPQLAGLIGNLLAEDPRYSLPAMNLWRFVTYMFTHEQIFHLLFNMLVLWFFAPDLESRWGRRTFWTFYLVTGAGAGLLHSLFALLTGREFGPTVGASGALHGVLLAYAAYYPNRMILLWGVFPVLVKYLVAFIILFSVFALGSGRESQVSNVTHLAGLLIAYVYLARYHHTSDITRWRYMN